MDMKVVIIVCVLMVCCCLGLLITGYFTNWFGLQKATGTTGSSGKTNVTTAAPATRSSGNTSVTTAAPATYTYLPFIDSAGSDLPGSPFTTATVGACASLCTKTPGCVGISYGPASTQCWLKSQLNNSNLGPAFAPQEKILGVPASSYPMAGFSSILAAGGNLLTGSALVSPSQLYALLNQPDGNLVIYNLTTDKAVFATGTNGKPNMPFTLSMQSDGRFLLYDSAGTALWRSNALKQPAAAYTLIMQDDGNLVVYDPNNKPYWLSNTKGM